MERATPVGIWHGPLQSQGQCITKLDDFGVLQMPLHRFLGRQHYLMDNASEILAAAAFKQQSGAFHRMNDVQKGNILFPAFQPVPPVGAGSRLSACFRQYKGESHPDTRRQDFWASAHNIDSYPFD